MTLEEEDKLCFLVCWEDRQSGLQRNFHLYFYPSTNSVEMFDIRTRKVFLKKTESDQIRKGDLYIGNTLVLYSRSLKVLDYGDTATRETVSLSTENTVALIKPGAVPELGQILSRVRLEGIRLARAKMLHLTRHQAEHFYSKFKLDPLFEDMVTELTSGVCVVMELVGSNVVQKWLRIISLKGTGSEETVSDLHSKTVYGSADQKEAEDDINYFFPQSRLVSKSMQTPSSHHLSNATLTSCCVVRPHAYAMAGEIIQDILSSGFQIVGMETFLLDFGKADEFLEVYKGVIENYGDAVKELSSGPCIALQIIHNEDPDNVVPRFRELCGPQDPAVAKTLRPKTLRAKYGESLTRNGVHCTDLKEDGPLEVEYFFSVLQ